MGCGASSMRPLDSPFSPSSTNVAILQQYTQPSLAAKIEGEFLKALFLGKSPKQDDVLLNQHLSFKKASLILDFDAMKQQPSVQSWWPKDKELGGLCEISGYEFNRGKGPYVYIIADWLGQLSPYITLIQKLIEDNFKVIALNIYQSHPPHGFRTHNVNSVGPYLLSAFHLINSTYHPACVISFGAASFWIFTAMSHGIFTKNNQGGAAHVAICPANDFEEYVQRLCDMVQVEKTDSLMESVVDCLGMPIPPSISSLRLSLPKPLLLLHSDSKRQLEISQLLCRSINQYSSASCGCTTLQCELNLLNSPDYPINLFDISTPSKAKVIEKIIAFVSVNAFGANLGRNGSLGAIHRSLENAIFTEKVILGRSETPPLGTPRESKFESTRLSSSIAEEVAVVGGTGVAAVLAKRRSQQAGKVTELDSSNEITKVAPIVPRAMDNQYKASPSLPSAMSPSSYSSYSPKKSSTLRKSGSDDSIESLIHEIERELVD